VAVRRVAEHARHDVNPGRRVIRRSESPNRQIFVGISFVVPAHNEERLIGATLDAIHAAAREVAQPYEVVVANDASTDETAAIARARGARVVDCEHRQIARVRNTGARASTGHILVFVDADTRISTTVVRASLSAIEAGAVGGGATVHIEGRQPWWGPAVLFAVIESMRARGARVSDEEFPVVLDYLATNFAGEALQPLNLNRATQIDLEAAGGLLRREAAAVIRYRDEHGPFKSLEDLRNVPGLDYSKIERRKDAIVVM